MTRQYMAYAATLNHVILTAQPHRACIEVIAAPKLAQPHSASHSIFVTRTAGCSSHESSFEFLSALLQEGHTVLAQPWKAENYLRA